MIKPIKAVDEYVATLPEERRIPMSELRSVILQHLPAGFAEVMQDIPSYVVPLSIFPQGYHCASNTPLPFMSISSQKNHIALNHFGMYVDQELMQWFVAEYPRHMKGKLDRGKSCVRFKKIDELPYKLIGQLAAQRTVDEWVASYQKALQ